MIIWLASYPKSGNTFLRSLLSAYFFTKDGNFQLDLLDKITQFPNINIFKKFGVDTSNDLEIVKNYINIQLLKETQKSEELKDLGELGVLLTGLAGKFVETMVDTYLNPEGLSMLIEKSEKKDEIPKPTLLTLIGGFTIMDFNSLSSFYITYENKGQEFPVFFNRKGLTWKITQIEFPENLLGDLK